MRLFLMNSSRPGEVHGKDYDKGLNGRECGKDHEFNTRANGDVCSPVFLTEEEIGGEAGIDSGFYTEIVPLHSGKVVTRIDMEMKNED